MINIFLLFLNIIVGFVLLLILIIIWFAFILKIVIPIISKIFWKELGLEK